MPADDDDEAGLDWLNAQLGGESDGEPAGEPAGEPVGEPVGEPAGEPAGEPVGEPAGEAADESRVGEAPVESDGTPAALPPEDSPADLPAPAPVPATIEPEALEPETLEPEPLEPEPLDALEPLEPLEPAGTGARSAADLEPEPWWTTPAQSPLVPTADEAAAIRSLRAPGPVETRESVATPGPDQTSDPVHTPGPDDARRPAAPAAATRPAAAPLPLETPSGTAPVPPSRPAGTRGRASRITLILGWSVGGLLAIAVLVALFMLGRQLLGGPAPVAAPTPTATTSPTPAAPTPTPTETAGATGPQPAGVHAWDSLRGGECLEPYASPWEEEFTVVGCATPHTAELVYRGDFAGETDAPFPGEEALAAQINVLCSAPGVIDLTAAAAFPDVQVQGSYPVTDEQWTSGKRNYYCFVSRSSAEPLTTGVAGPGPAPAA